MNIDIEKFDKISEKLTTKLNEEYALLCEKKDPLIGDETIDPKEKSYKALKNKENKTEFAKKDARYKSSMINSSSQDDNVKNAAKLKYKKAVVDNSKAKYERQRLSLLKEEFDVDAYDDEDIYLIAEEFEYDLNEAEELTDNQKKMLRNVAANQISRLNQKTEDAVEDQTNLVNKEKETQDDLAKKVEIAKQNEAEAQAKVKKQSEEAKEKIEKIKDDTAKKIDAIQNYTKAATNNSGQTQAEASDMQKIQEEILVEDEKHRKLRKLNKTDTKLADAKTKKAEMESAAEESGMSNDELLNNKKYKKVCDLVDKYQKKYTELNKYVVSRESKRGQALSFTEDFDDDSEFYDILAEADEFIKEHKKVDVLRESCAYILNSKSTNPMAKTILEQVRFELDKEDRNESKIRILKMKFDQYNK